MSGKSQLTVQGDAQIAHGIIIITIIVVDAIYIFNIAITIPVQQPQLLQLLKIYMIDCVGPLFMG